MNHLKSSLVAAVLTVAAGTAVWTGVARSDDLDAHPVHDGTYLGYVRTVDGRTDELAVDLSGSDTPEAVLEAGGLAQLDIVGPGARPFRITIKSNAIVALATADDVLPVAPSRH